MADARSPLSVIYLLHIALEAPLAIQGMWAPYNLPFLDMNNTSLIIVKLYAMLLVASCVVAFLVYPLPEFLPGKRATSLGFLIYHTMAATALFQAARFIPHTFGNMAESIKIYPETLWAAGHAVLSIGFGLWWQGTLAYARAIKQQ